jgi:hypothetical protein
MTLRACACRSARSTRPADHRPEAAGHASHGQEPSPCARRPAASRRKSSPAHRRRMSRCAWGFTHTHRSRRHTLDKCRQARRGLATEQTLRMRCILERTKHEAPRGSHVNPTTHTSWERKYPELLIRAARLSPRAGASRPGQRWQALAISRLRRCRRPVWLGSRQMDLSMPWAIAALAHQSMSSRQKDWRRHTNFNDGYGASISDRPMSAISLTRSFGLRPRRAAFGPIAFQKLIFLRLRIWERPHCYGQHKFHAAAIFCLTCRSNSLRASSTRSRSRTRSNPFAPPL